MYLNEKKLLFVLYFLRENQLVKVQNFDFSDVACFFPIFSCFLFCF